jgi:hypothetical protein
LIAPALTLTTTFLPRSRCNVHFVVVLVVLVLGEARRYALHDLACLANVWPMAPYGTSLAELTIDCKFWTGQSKFRTEFN